MSKVIRQLLDLSLGHCYPPKACLTGSTDVFIGGIPIVRVGDNYSQDHTCGNQTHSMGPAIEGSPTVFNNGLAVHGSGHKISCGDVANNGALTVTMDEA